MTVFIVQWADVFNQSILAVCDSKEAAENWIDRYQKEKEFPPERDTFKVTGRRVFNKDGY